MALSVHHAYAAIKGKCWKIRSFFLMRPSARPYSARVLVTCEVVEFFSCVLPLAGLRLFDDFSFQTLYLGENYPGSESILHSFADRA